MIKTDYDKNPKLYELLLKLNLPCLSRMMFNRVYDTDFFSDGNQWKTSCAATVARVITDRLHFDSLFDIGCGMGIFTEQFHLIGKEVLGCDLSTDGLKLSSKAFTIFHADVTKPIQLNRKYDIAMCFEVAEHIPKKYSKQLVSNCVNNGNNILFTAAPVGQPGVGHINCQPYEFWIDLFRAEGYTYQSAVSEEIRSVFKSEDVVWWITNNFMFFSRNDIS